MIAKKNILDMDFSDNYALLLPKMNHYHTALFVKNAPSRLKFAPNMQYLEENFPQFGNLKESYYTWLYVDLFCHELLGTITFLLTNKELNFSLEELKELNNVVLELIQKYPAQNMEAIGSTEETLYYFSSYYDIRDRFLQDTNILKYITNHCGKRENPKPEYTISSPADLLRDFSIDEIKKIFTEGKETKDDTFRKNYDSCKKGIDEFNKKARRNIINNLLAQKAMYREIYADPTLYAKNRHTSKNIFLNFLKNGTMASSDYYFLDEKINMGMYREHGLIDEFYAKNEFQENFYHLICLILSRLYPDKILFILKNCLTEISCKLENILKRNSLKLSELEFLKILASAISSGDIPTISVSDKLTP